jgi:hypothetical protein
LKLSSINNQKLKATGLSISCLESNSKSQITYFVLTVLSLLQTLVEIPAAILVLRNLPQKRLNPPDGTFSIAGTVIVCDKALGICQKLVKISPKYRILQSKDWLLLLTWWHRWVLVVITKVRYIQCWQVEIENCKYCILCVKELYHIGIQYLI